jgi:phosphoribosylaminoimidazolecarboxamide formyltransferase/IMP cyclohydrolase
MRVVTANFDALRELPAAGDLEHGADVRSFLGGVLTQERDQVIEAREPWPYFRLKAEATGIMGAAAAQELFPRVVTRRQPTPEEWTALRFAWRVCAHVKSNTIVFTGADRSLAVGAGQMSRVDAVKVAVMKAAVGSLKGSVAASDAFFPFRDGLDAIADAGATAVVQPGGSVRDAEVIAAADERGLAMVFTGRRHFRH